jgi:outer membrane protein TolC
MKVEEREWTYGISQEIPFPGKLRLRGEVAIREAERTEQAYLAVPLRVMARLKEAFYDLSLVHTSIDIVEKNKLVLRDFEQTAQARYAVGKGVQQDIFRAQTEVSRLLTRLAILEQRKVSLHADINRLLNRPPADPLGTPPPLQVTRLQRSLADLSALLEQASPLVQAQLKGVERDAQSLALARRDFLPDFAVSVGGVRNETISKNGYQVMLGIKVPLYYATKLGKVDFLTLLSSLLTLQDNELELHSEIVEHEKALARLEEIIGRAP